MTKQMGFAHALCFFATTLTATSVRAAPKKIAVLEFVNKASLTAEEAGFLSDLVRTEATALPADKFSVMTRENMLTMLPPGVTLANCVGKCEVETGRNVGADFIVTGRVIKFGKQYKITIKMHRTSDGSLVAGDRASGASIEALEAPLIQKCRAVFARLMPKGKDGPKNSGLGTVAAAAVAPKAAEAARRPRPRSISVSDEMDRQAVESTARNSASKISAKRPSRAQTESSRNTKPSRNTNTIDLGILALASPGEQYENGIYGLWVGLRNFEWKTIEMWTSFEFFVGEVEPSPQEDRRAYRTATPIIMANQWLRFGFGPQSPAGSWLPRLRYSVDIGLGLAFGGTEYEVEVDNRTSIEVRRESFETRAFVLPLRINLAFFNLHVHYQFDSGKAAISTAVFGGGFRFGF